MHSYVIEALGGLVPEKIKIRKSRDEKEFLFVRCKDKKILVLNPTAREIYDLCDGRTVTEIVKVMCSNYPDIDREKMSLDTLKFLRSMEASELVVLK
jgi:hypothetical protein